MGCLPQDEATDRDARRRRAAAAGEDWDEEEEDADDLAAAGRAGLLPVNAGDGGEGEDEGLANEREEAAEYQQHKLMEASQVIQAMLSLAHSSSAAQPVDEFCHCGVLSKMRRLATVGRILG